MTRLADGVLPQEWNGQYDVLWVRIAALVLALVPLAVGVGLLVTGRGGDIWFFGLPVAAASR